MSFSVGVIHTVKKISTVLCMAASASQTMIVYIVHFAKILLGLTVRVIQMVHKISFVWVMAASASQHIVFNAAQMIVVHPVPIANL